MREVWFPVDNICRLYEDVLQLVDHSIIPLLDHFLNMGPSKFTHRRIKIFSDLYAHTHTHTQVEYLMKKISTAMNQEWDGKPLEDLLSQDASVQEEGMSVWVFLDHMGAGRLLRVSNAGAFSLALDQVFLEMYHNVLKRVSWWDYMDVAPGGAVCVGCFYVCLR